MFYTHSEIHRGIRKHAFRMAVVLCGAASLAGCGGSREIVAAGSEEEAVEVLTAALDAWKAGETPETLRNEAPPMFVRDTDWMDGRTLKAFEPRETPRGNGGEWRVQAVLTLAGAGQQEEQKLVAYSVTTEPHAIVITRSDDID